MNDSKTDAPHVQRTARASFGMVDAAVIRDATLPAMVKLVYTYLSTYCSDVRSAYPSKARIARETGISVRSVDGAILAAEKAGLLTVRRRPRDNRDNETNIYLLHDLGGGYVAGSGDPTPPAAGAGGVGQEMRESPAGGAPELDQRSRPASTETTSTSSDAACAPRAAARGRDSATRTPTLHLRRDFSTLTDKGVRRHLVAAALKAMEHVGFTPTADAAQRIGQALKVQHEAGKTRDQLAQMLRDVISDPGKHDIVATPHVPAQRAPEASNPAAGLDPDDLEFCEQVEELVEEATGDGVRCDTTAMIYGMTAGGAHPNAIYNAARKSAMAGSPWD